MQKKGLGEGQDGEDLSETDNKWRSESVCIELESCGA